MIDNPIYELANGDRFRISYAEDILIDNINDKFYRIKLFIGDELKLERDMSPYTWVAFPLNAIEPSRIEFYDDENQLIDTYNNDLNEGNILLNVKFPLTFVGKNYDIGLLDNYVGELQHKYKCKIWVYFKGSEKYNLEGKPYNPLRMNVDVPFFNLMTTIYV